MIAEARVRELADKMAKRLNAGTPYQEALRSVFQGLRGDERAVYISAVASELSMRRHISEARKRPDAPARETAPPPRNQPPDAQLGFGFGEGPRTKIRPPTRRHL